MSYKRGASSYRYQDSGHGFDDIHSQDPRTKTSRLNQFDGHRHHVSGPWFSEDTIALKFPHEPEWVHEDDGPDSLGLTNLEIIGLERFRHVRCPRASEPCPGNCGRYGCHVDSLIIACDGACPHNGTPNVLRSSFGSGWLTVKKTPVANQDLWAALLVKISELGELGASVAFWLVPREENQDADELANEALENNSDW
ncbi:hypothetical protein QBC37DRAFT_392547 [Rhypophila decipiens]|uniref:RNase H type-1 domain-containing protein n=1 Tax=Rhypophila decipiens TaxID=261697 RepID=A0AAN6XW39_9PEZI|nr:hypothetical protein QBC37DRAFT_392547 [Rhypophila decipiens]